MKYWVILAILMISTGFYCSKKEETPGSCKVDLQIIRVQTPLTAIRGNDIISLVKCSGIDLCYDFSHMEITEAGNHIYDIRAKANYPCTPATCLQAIYYADATVDITPTQAGPYVLRYFNGNNLFQSDTIVIQ